MPFALLKRGTHTSLHADEGFPYVPQYGWSPSFLKFELWKPRLADGFKDFFDVYLGRWSNLTNNYFLSGLKPLPRYLWMDDIYVYIWFGSTPQRGQWKKWRFRGLEFLILQMESTVTVPGGGVVPIYMIFDITWYMYVTLCYCNAMYAIGMPFVI